MVREIEVNPMNTFNPDRNMTGNQVPKPSRHIRGYLGLTALFFLLSFFTIYVIHSRFSGGLLHLKPGLLTPRTLVSIALLLGCYYLADGLRLYHVIRAMDFKIRFRNIMKLVFINVFVSNITPLATGGGVAQVYFLHREGIPIGEGTAATSIRTMLAAMILFTLTPIIILAEPKLFSFFTRGKIVIYVVVVCVLYLALSFTIIFRTKLIRYWIYRVMIFFDHLGILARSRSRRWYLKLSKELARFTDGFRRFIGGRPLHVALSILFTILFLLVLFSFSIVLMKAMGYAVHPLTILAFQVVVTFFMYFAPTPGAAGVAEGGYGILFARLVSKGDLTLLTLLWRFLTIYVGVLIGLFIVYRELFSRGREMRQ